MFSQHRILGGLQIEDFISEVKKYPPIWDPGSFDTRQQYIKERQPCWLEVARALMEDFDNQPESERYKIITKMTEKWRCLRDGYDRSIRVGKKRGLYKPYIYASQMDFLEMRTLRPKDDYFERDQIEQTQNDIEAEFTETDCIIQETKAELAMFFCKGLQLNFTMKSFINEIEKRQAIWDPRSHNGSFSKNKVLKRRAWTDIARKLVTGYGDMSKEEQKDLVKKMILRWRTVRDRYIRAMKNGAEYNYAPYLKFLAPNFLKKRKQSKSIKRGTSTTVSSSNSDADAVEEDEDAMYFEINQESEMEGVSDMDLTGTSQMLPGHTFMKSEPNDPADIEVNDTLRVHENEDYDYNNLEFVSSSNKEKTEVSDDSLFFGSLLPVLREFDIDQKLQFRSEVLALISKIRKQEKP